jgi:hypothetical protein
MPHWYLDVETPQELDARLRSDVLALDNLGRGDEIYGTVYVTYTDATVMRASLVPDLEARGVRFLWHKKEEEEQWRPSSG